MTFMYQRFFQKRNRVRIPTLRPKEKPLNYNGSGVFPYFSMVFRKLRMNINVHCVYAILHFEGIFCTRDCTRHDGPMKPTRRPHDRQMASKWQAHKTHSKKRTDSRPNFLLDVIHTTKVPGSVQARHQTPPVCLRSIKRCIPASRQVVCGRLMDVPLRLRGSLPPTKQFYRLLRWHVQVDHKVRLRQPQPAVFKIRKPPEEPPAIPHRNLAPLMDRIRRGVPISQH